MFENHIFVCHAGEQAAEAKQIAIALRERGYEVFLDKDSLPTGRSYNVRIERAVKKSAGFVFLISRASVEAGRYTLTELDYAERKWRHPDQVLVPVMIEPTDMKALPEYIKSVTFHTPKGNIGAEVSSRVNALVPVRNWSKIGIAAAVVLVLGLIVVVGGYQMMKPVGDAGDYTTQENNND